MSSSLSHSIIVRHEPERAVTPLHILVLSGLSLGAALWWITSILGSQGLQFQRYLALLAFYAAASAVFVGSRIRRGTLQVFEIPVFFTGMSFLQFGLVPLRNFIDPSQIERHLSANGEELVQALSYCVLGMVAYWVGCQAVRRKQSGQMSSGPSQEDTVPAWRQARIMSSAIAFSAVSFGIKFYLLAGHLHAYGGNFQHYYENLASMQVLNAVGQLGSLALVVASIERYRNQSNPAWKVIFWAIFSSEVLWGAMSGSKGLLFQNFITVAVVSSLVQRRLNLRWILPAVFGVVLFYPISDAYRSLLHKPAGEVTSFAQAGRVGGMALKDASRRAEGVKGLWTAGLRRTVSRIELLTSVADILVLGPRASFVKGDLPWRMLPIYPFVPRFVWPSKPILDEAARFTVALGGSMNSSTAVTYPGDLYLQFGLLGIPVGMFLLGVVGQWFTNRLSGPIGRHDLFIYVCVLRFSFATEADVFGLWAGFVRLLVMLYVLSWGIYGPRSRPGGVLHHLRTSGQALRGRPGRV